jgi:hypothetical protein
MVEHLAKFALHGIEGSLPEMRVSKSLFHVLELDLSSQEARGFRTGLDGRASWINVCENRG